LYNPINEERRPQKDGTSLSFAYRIGKTFFAHQFNNIVQDRPPWRRKRSLLGARPDAFTLWSITALSAIDRKQMKYATFWPSRFV
jgi:hypothetical protein